MELNAQYTFTAPIERVWERLMDPATIAACVPGCQEFEPVGDDRYRIVLTAGIAAISGSFAGSVAMTDKRPPTSYRLIVEGSGRPGFASGESRITLTASENGVVVDVAGTMAIGGLVAQVGQRLLGATARAMMDRFFNCLKSKM
jgi:carbon monoxide dehydrogenase subunit G